MFAARCRTTRGTRDGCAPRIEGQERLTGSSFVPQIATAFVNEAFCARADMNR